MRKSDLEAPAALPEQARTVESKSPRSRGSAPFQRLAYSVREAEAVSGLSRSTLYVLMGKKKLVSIRVGGRRLITHEALVALLNGGAI